MTSKTARKGITRIKINALLNCSFDGLYKSNHTLFSVAFYCVITAMKGVEEKYILHFQVIKMASHQSKRERKIRKVLEKLDV